MIVRTISRRRRLAAAAVAGVVAVGVVGGCSAHPGAAAVVNGQRISTGDVAAIENDFEFMKASISGAGIVNFLVRVPAIHAVAKEAGASQSDADAVTYLAENFATPQKVSVEGHRFAPQTLDLARAMAETQKMSGMPNAEALGEQLNARLKQESVTVNPRFGLSQVGDSYQHQSFPWIVQKPADLQLGQ